MPATPSTPATSTSRRVVGRRLAMWGWAFIVLSVAISCVWTYSGWYSIDLWSRNTPTSEFDLGIWSGAVQARESVPWDRTGGQVIFGPREPQWRIDWTAFEAGTYAGHRGMPQEHYVTVGLWPLIAASACAGVGLLVSARWSRLRQLGPRCPRCGYSMRSLAVPERGPSPTCPECGPIAAGWFGRKRRACGVMVLAAAAVVGGVVVASRVWDVDVTKESRVVRVRGGALSIRDEPWYDTEAWVWRWRLTPSAERRFEWRARGEGPSSALKLWASSGDGYPAGEPDVLLMVVLWPVAVGLAVGGVALVRSGQRARERRAVVV